MRIEDHVAVLRHDGERIAEVAERAGLDAEVTTCSGWRIRDLLQHLGGVHRWAASYVTTSRAGPYPPADEEAFFAPVADDALVDWFRRGHRALVGALGTADATLACWTFLPAPSPLAFWARRQAHETAIHRADAESALGAVPDWDPAFAADGIDELLNGFFGRPGGRLRADPPRSLAVSATDVPVSWTVHLRPDGRRVDGGRERADLTVTGRAADLYLLLWNRAGTERLDVLGDREVLQLWRDRATVTWS